MELFNILTKIFTAFAVIYLLVVGVSLPLPKNHLLIVKNPIILGTLMFFLSNYYINNFLISGLAVWLYFYIVDLKINSLSQLGDQFINIFNQFRNNELDEDEYNQILKERNEANVSKNTNIVSDNIISDNIVNNEENNNDQENNNDEQNNGDEENNNDEENNGDENSNLNSVVPANEVCNDTFGTVDANNVENDTLLLNTEQHDRPEVNLDNVVPANEGDIDQVILNEDNVPSQVDPIITSIKENILENPKELESNVSEENNLVKPITDDVDNLYNYNNLGTEVKKTHEKEYTNDVIKSIQNIDNVQSLDKSDNFAKL